jgi:hypothetical protein
VQFESRTDLSGESGVIADPEPLVLAARLLGVERDQLETALVKKKSLVIRGACSTQAAAGLCCRYAMRWWSLVLLRRRLPFERIAERVVMLCCWLLVRWLCLYLICRTVKHVFTSATLEQVRCSRSL